MSKVRLDSDQFFTAVKSIYDYWKDSSNEDSKIKQVKSIAVVFGNNKAESYSKSSSIHKWLFGYELTDTIIVFTKNNIHIATSKKKLEFLAAVKEQNKENSPKIQFHTKAKGDNESLLTKLSEIMTKQSKVGILQKDLKSISVSTEFAQSVTKRIPDGHVDISADIAVIMGPKTATEMTTIKHSAKITTHIYNKGVKDHILKMIDKDKKVKHSKVSEEIERCTEDKDKCSGYDPDLIETAYPPIIQSGGNYALKYSAQSDENNLHFGTIVSMFGIKYKSYCSNIGRVLMVNPTSSQEKNYEALCKLEDQLIAALVPGKKCSDVYQTVQSKCPDDLKRHLTKTFGSIIGIEFKDSAVTISAKCQAKLAKGMVFNVGVGLNDLSNSEASDPKNKKYSLFLADTVHIGDSGGESNVVLTASAKKRLKSCKINIIDEEGDEEESDNDLQEGRDFTKYGRGKRNADSNQAFQVHQENETKRKLKQKTLLERLNDEAMSRLKGGNLKGNESKLGTDARSYEKPGELPYHEPDVQQHKISIDRKAETILFPIAQMPAPVHISMIKNVTLSVEGIYHYLRINFYHPGSTLGRLEGANFTHPDMNFLKEVTFRSTQEVSQNLNTAARLLKEIQKRMRTRQQEEKEKKGLVKQDKLVINPNFRGARLKSLYMRPSLGQKRMPGILEAHTNGFRYQNVRQERVDLLFNNIKHAIFQPCDHEMIMVLHFKLKNFILLNKKKVQDIQFYMEVGEITTDLMKSGNVRDRDDLHAEAQEREHRNKLKKGFKSFIDRVENISKEIDFDTPFRELGFHGAPNRSTCLLQPTSSCLINVVEWPSFVISIDEIECVHFERVTFSIKNFDMVIIPKDYTIKVATISSIPMKSLDEIKNWLNSCDIRYTEGVTSLNWAKIMKTILEDVDGFFETGGWNFLDADDEDQNADEDEELEKAEDEDFDGDDAFGSDADDDSSDYTDEDSDGTNYSDEDESGSDVSLAESEESGKDWDELEAEARRADKHQEYDEEEEDNDRKRKKSKKSHSHSKGAPKAKKQKRR